MSDSVLAALLDPLRSRDAASQLLSRVADRCEIGHWPHEFSPRQAGYAIARALGTFFDPNDVRAEFLEGFDAYCARRRG